MVDYSLYWQKDHNGEGGVDLHWACSPAAVRPAARLQAGGPAPPSAATMYRTFRGPVLQFLRYMSWPLAQPCGAEMLLAEVDAGEYLGERGWQVHAGVRGRSKIYCFRDQAKRTSAPIEVSSLVRRTSKTQAGVSASLQVLPVELKAGLQDELEFKYCAEEDPTLQIRVYSPTSDPEGDQSDLSIESYLQSTALDLMLDTIDSAAVAQEVNESAQSEITSELISYFSPWIEEGRNVAVEAGVTEVNVEAGGYFEVPLTLQRADERSSATMLAIEMLDDEGKPQYTSEPLLFEWDDDGFLFSV